MFRLSGSARPASLFKAGGPCPHHHVVSTSRNFKVVQRWTAFSIVLFLLFCFYTFFTTTRVHHTLTEGTEGFERKMKFLGLLVGVAPAWVLAGVLGGRDAMSGGLEVCYFSSYFLMVF